ncbi:hypothetical protein Q7P37_006164 [Cladosporium fusiforme]
MDYFNSEQFSSRVETILLDNHVPGVSVAVVHGDRTSSKSYGKSSLSPEAPCTPSTLFDIASSSKSLTAAAVALLVEDDSHPDVQWDTPVAKLLPGDFIMSDDRYTNEITVEDILCHRTGLPVHDASYMSPKAAHPDDAKSVTRNIRNLALAAPPRTKYMYCNLMYTAASYLVEVVSGMAFPDFLEENFFKPLGMTSTNMQPARAKERGLGDRIATGHFWDDKTNEYKAIEAWDCPDGQGAGSIVTTAEDYLKWVKALMNCEGPITEDVYKGLVKMRIITEPDPHDKSVATNCSAAAYAAGLEVYWYRGVLVIGHDGCIAGFGSTHFFLPSLKFGAVILGNGSDAWSVTAVLSKELIDEALQVPLSERPAWAEHQKSLVEAEEPKEELDELRKKQGLDGEEPEKQVLPLEAYTGTYTNAGYHEMVVTVKDGELFVDATERSSGGFFLRFEHVCQQRKYIAHLASGYEGGDELLAAEFELEDDRAVSMGVHLEVELEELIWFKRIA